MKMIRLNLGFFRGNVESGKNLNGRIIEELMIKYNLSYDTIKKIVYLK